MSKELKTGIVSIVIIALFVWGYYFLKGQDLLQPNARHFFIEYNGIQGLNEASAVTINGLKVGKVVDIHFNESPEKRGKLVVEILLENDFEFSNKSIAKIYSTSLMGGQNLAIVPSYVGDLAKSGDYLKGEVESDIFSSVGEKLNPIQSKIENVIVSADSLLTGLNQILDDKSKASLNRSVLSFEKAIDSIGSTIERVNSLLSSTENDLKISLRNTKKITANFSKISDTLAQVNLGAVIKKVETTLENVSSLIAGIEAGKGSLGKLATDDAMYNNLSNASNELAELLKEMKLHPKRFVHFSVFGKKAKPYVEEENKTNK